MCGSESWAAREGPDVSRACAGSAAGPCLYKKSPLARVFVDYVAIKFALNDCFLIHFLVFIPLTIEGE